MILLNFFEVLALYEYNFKLNVKYVCLLNIMCIVLNGMCKENYTNLRKLL